MDDIYLRIRIDGAIAEKVTQMAHELDMELPTVIRIFLAQSAQVGEFAIEQRPPPQQQAAGARMFLAYDEDQWDPLKTVLDGELALALLNQRLADCTVALEALLDDPAADSAHGKQVKELRRQRDETRAILMGLDPSDRVAVRAILDEFAPQREGAEDSATGVKPRNDEPGASD